MYRGVVDEQETRTTKGGGEKYILIGTGIKVKGVRPVSDYSTMGRWCDGRGGVRSRSRSRGPRER